MDEGTIIRYGRFHNGVHDQDFALRQFDTFLEWFELGAAIEPGRWSEFSTGVRAGSQDEAMATARAEWPRMTFSEQPFPPSQDPGKEPA